MNTSTKKDTAKDKNINISSLNEDFKNLRHTFSAYTNRSTMQQKLFQNFLPQKAWIFGNKIENKLQNPCPKLKKYVYDIFTKNICSTCSPTQVVVFSQKCISFVEQRLKFSHFEGSIITQGRLNFKTIFVTLVMGKLCNNWIRLVFTIIFAFSKFLWFISKEPVDIEKLHCCHLEV